MLDTVRSFFRSRRQSLPSAEQQANIANLAVHYLDELCTRIERLANSGQIMAAKAEEENLLSCFRKPNNPEKADKAFDTTSCSTSCRLAIEYLEKLFALVDTLIEANRIQEVQALTVFLDQINQRRNKCEKTLEAIAKRTRVRRK